MSNVAWDAYNQNSEGFFDVYESLSFANMHRSFLRFLPNGNGACLDVGAGSGRDAGALAARGYIVTAVEPSKKLLNLAKNHHHHPNITWVEDSLPKLNKLSSNSMLYDFILLSAVWMHILPGERREALINLKRLLKPKGFIAFTLRIGITGCDGRPMYPVSVKELTNQAEELGFVTVYQSRKSYDSLKRKDVEWRKVVLMSS